jgi:hypothetical protein
MHTKVKSQIISAAIMRSSNGCEVERRYWERAEAFIALEEKLPHFLAE